MSIHERLASKMSEIREKIDRTEKADLIDLVEGDSIYNTSVVPKLKNKEYLRAAVGWVYGAVNVIADEVASAQLRLKKYMPDGTTKEVIDHPALDLIYRANNATTRFDLLNLSSQYLELTGESPWFVSFKNGRPESILLLRPDRLKVIPGKDGELIAGYKYTVDGKDVDLEPWEVVPLKFSDPDNPLRGKGPLQAAAMAYDLDNYAEKWNSQFFKNSAVPDAVLQTDKTLSKDVRERLEKKLSQKYQGVDNAHKTIILEGGLEYKPMSLTQKDMEFISQQTFSRDKILAIFRVPRTALGITDDVNRANAEATDYVFAKRTIRPKLVRIQEQLNEFLLPLFGNSESLYFEFDDPVPQNMDQLVTRASSGVSTGYMTLNEARELMGLDPIEGGDILMGPTTMAPLENPDMPEDPEDMDPEDMPSKFLKAGPKKTGEASTYAKHSFSAKTRRAREDAAQRKFIAATIKHTITPVIYSLLKNKGGNTKEAMKKALEVSKSPLLTTPANELKGVKYEFQEKQLKVADEYEAKLVSKMNGVFDAQKEIILRAVEGGGKKRLDANTEQARYKKALQPVLVPMMRKQAELSFRLLGISKGFADEKAEGGFTKTLSNYFDQRTYKLSPELTRETNAKLAAAFKLSAEKEESVPEIKKRVSQVFEDMKGYRSERIARSETIRGSNFATEAAYKESGVVEAKEWLTTKDERTCSECNDMDGRTIPLGDNYFNKGETFGAYALDYESVGFPPLHVNCRCTLIPVIGKQVSDGEWAPALSKEQADKFIKDSKVKDTLYHGTTNFAKDNIERNGFNLSSGAGNVVDGIYLAESSKLAEEYAMSAVGASNVPHAKPATLALKVNVKSVKNFTWHGLYDAMKAKLGDNFTPADVEDYFKSIGVDAIRVNDEVAGQSYLAVFDPKKVVVLKK